MTNEEAIACAEALKKHCLERQKCKGCPFCLEITYGGWDVKCALVADYPSQWKIKMEEKNGYN